MFSILPFSDNDIHSHIIVCISCQMKDRHKKERDKRMAKNASFWFKLVFLGALLVTGCSNNGSSEKATPGEQSNQTATTAAATTQDNTATVAAYPKTIKHLAGETVIPQKPLKIATPYIAFVDYLAVLDEYPIAAQGVATIQRNFPVLSKRLENKDIADLGMEVDLEKLLAMTPDVIIAANDMTDQYESLSRIAPTVILPQAGDWRETLEQIAQVIGKEDKAKSVLADFDRKSAEYKEKLAFRSQESVMFVMYNEKDTFTTWNDGRFDPFYVGLGLKRVDGNQAQGQLSIESLAALNPDHLFVINNWQTPIAGGVKAALKDNKVWNSLNAVKNNHVYELKDPSLPGPMALAKIQGIEDIMQAMGQ